MLNIVNKAEAMFIYGICFLENKSRKVCTKVHGSQLEACSILIGSGRKATTKEPEQAKVSES